MSAINVLDFVEPVFIEYGGKLLDALKSALQAAGKGGGALEQSLEVLIDGPIMQVLAADYLVYVIKGRQTGGRMPPIEPILAWIQAKGIQVTPKRRKDGTMQSLEQAQTSMAWAVAKSIQQDGEPGIDLLSAWNPIFDEMLVAISRATADWTRRSLAQALIDGFSGVNGIEIKTTFN